MQDFVHQPCGRCTEGFKPQLQPEPFTVISLGFIAFRGLGFQANLGGREKETEKESERESERAKAYSDSNKSCCGCAVEFGRGADDCFCSFTPKPTCVRPVSLSKNQ